MRTKLLILAICLFLLAGCGEKEELPETTFIESDWVPLFDGETLTGWTARGKATWEVRDGILTGIDGMGHLYTDLSASDLVIKGMFRVSEQGNSGLYFRANPPEDNPDGFPRGYEAQIDNHSDAHTGWLWKPGNPTCKASALLTSDNEWFSMQVKAQGDMLQIWVNDSLVTECQDSDYESGHFAIQAHNPGMIIEAKEIYYKELQNKEM